MAKPETETSLPLVTEDQLAAFFSGWLDESANHAYALASYADTI